jgi:hypothetical protein
LQRPREPGVLVFLRHIDLVVHNPTRHGRDVLNYCLEPKSISGDCRYCKFEFIWGVHRLVEGI